MSSNRRYPSLKFHGNLSTMNLNHLLLANIKSSHYFKNRLTDLHTFEEVVDEIYYRVEHLEPWERGGHLLNKSYKVYRGVGGGGIPSTAFCLLFKFHTLRPTQRQIIKLISHADSPYIRGLGFLYIRLTQAPDRLWAWFKGFVSDGESIVLKSDKSGQTTVGKMLAKLLFENDWFSAWLPRLPVLVMRDVRVSFSELKKRSERDE